MASYAEFLQSKCIEIAPSGFESNSLNSMLFDFQRDCVAWSLRRGKTSLFQDCGLGKTPQQLVWAEQVVRKLNKPVLILTPLAVSKQTVREAEKFGIEASVAASQADVKGASICVTNYEKLHHFDPSAFGGIVLDESSILKSYSGATRNTLVNAFNRTPMRLCATATPAPNDYMELGNHSEFLSVFTRTEMLSTFFVHDGGDTSKWRLKGHAEDEYWKWVCGWAVMLRKPSDLGYEDNGFILPPLNLVHHVVKTDKKPDGYLFVQEASSLIERRGARRDSLSERVEMAASIVAAKPDEPWMIWCDLNAEADLAERLIPNAVQVAGRHKDSEKEERMLAFSSGEIQTLVSKSSIAGYGMNWQHCSNVVYVGLSDSYEKFYQSIRRFWRFGQKNQVNCHVVTAEAEGAVVRNIKRKEVDAMRMAREMVKHMSVYNKEALHRVTGQQDSYKQQVERGSNWTLYLGDSVETLKSLPGNSIDLSIFSPPYSQLYCYSASERDLGNSRTDAEFYEHFNYVIQELLRLTRQGRIVAVDCMNLPAMKERDGYIGLKDFRGDLIRAFQQVGFIYHSEHCVWKDPLIEATRTKSLGLMHKQLVKDSSMARAGLPQYLLAFRKPGDNEKPVSHPDGMEVFYGENPPTTGVLSHERWRRYASPIWNDINPSNTLQKESAREDKDEKHICPMSLDMIERAVWLWSKEGDVVLDPFCGIGSTGYVAVQRNRRFVGVELKNSYFQQSVANLKNAELMVEQNTLFSGVA
jgi:DNA modification methylase